MEKHKKLFMGKSTSSVAMFNSKLLVYQGIPRKILGQPPAKPAEPAEPVASPRSPPHSSAKFKKHAEPMLRVVILPSKKWEKLRLNHEKSYVFKHETLEKYGKMMV